MSGGVELFVTGPRGSQGPQGSGAIATFGSQRLAASMTIRYLPPGYNSGVAPTTPVDVAVAIDQQIDAIAFFCRVAHTGGTITYTLRKNGAPTGVSVSIAGGSTTGRFVAGAAVSYSAAANDQWGVETAADELVTAGPTDPMIMIGKT